MSKRLTEWSSLGFMSALLSTVLAMPVAAQETPPQVRPEGEISQAPETQNEGIGQAARTADTGIGEVGQRQTVRDGAALQDPLDRIASRIDNRIENRIRNRIDRNYDPTANATSPYEIADRQTRASRVTGPR